MVEEKRIDDPGRILKEIRENKGLTLRKVSSDTGLSVSFLSKLENGKTSITVKNLVRLLNYYGVTLPEVFATQKSGRIIFPMETRKVVESQESITLETLIDLPRTVMEPLLATFKPRTKYRDRLKHEGDEFAIVLKGEMRFEFDGVSYYMKEGDCAYFPGSKEHGWENISDADALVLMVIAPPGV